MECFKGLPDVEEAKSDKYTELEEMVKKFNHGGNFYPKGSKWEMDTRKPKDFLSLIRNVIHTKITLHLGLKARLLSSKSG